MSIIVVTCVLIDKKIGNKLSIETVNYYISLHTQLFTNTKYNDYFLSGRKCDDK